MDPAVIVDNLWKCFSTRQGLELLKDLYLYTFSVGLGEFLKSDFGAEGCREYEDYVRACLKNPPNEETKKHIQQAVIKSIVYCIDRISGNVKKYDLFQVIRFCYGTLLCLDVTETIHKENSLVGQRALMLWQICFLENKSWKEDNEKSRHFFSDMVLLVTKYLKKNPEFCIFLLPSLEDFVRENKLTREDHDHKIGSLCLLKGHCYYHLNRLDSAIQMYKKASELFECNCYLPYELLAKTLQKQGKLKAAISQLEFAIEFEKDFAIQRHLQDLMNDLIEEIKKEVDATKQDSSCHDNSQIDNLAMMNTKAQEVKEAHSRKKKPNTKFISYPKAKRKHQEQSTESDCDNVESTKLKISDKNKNAKELKKLYPKEEFQKPDHKSCYPDWSSDDDESFQIVTEDVPKQGKRITEIEKINWFEVSKKKYKKQTTDTKIYSGMLMDLNECPPNLNKQIKKESFYRTMESKEKLEKLMITKPNEFKRCRITLKSAHEAACKVLSSDEHSEIEIHGRSKCGQTFNNDEVCVQILSKPKQHAPGGRFIQGVKDDNKVYGRVVGILESSFKKERNPVVACKCDRNESYLMLPLCGSIQKFHVRNERSKTNDVSNGVDIFTKNEKGDLSFKKTLNIQPGQQDRYVFLVVFLKWDIEQVYPLGAVVDFIEYGTDITGEIKLLELKYKVPSHFEKITVDHVEEVLKTKDPKQLEKRHDLRELIVFTIDPEHSKDLDDALSICKKEDHLIVGVHIADVAAVVKKGDPIDKEAERRATSFYPSDSRVRHMLPEPLSEQLCSLLPNEDKRALSVFFHIEESGNVKDVSVKRTLIRSSLKLSYKVAQKVIEGDTVEAIPEIIKEGIHLLHRIAQNLRNGRKKDSRFAVPFLDTEALEDAPEAHALIEEFMIKANTFIADWLKKKYPDSIPIRCQSEPPLEELQKFVKTEDKVLDLVVELQGREILPARKVAAENVVAKGNSMRKEYLPVQKNVWLQILDGVHAGNMKDAMKALCQDEVHPFQAVALDHWRSIMETAEYRCSMETERNLNHFSLQTKLYTNFTSPIRRYVDLVVHRLVHAALDDQPCPYSPKEVSEMCAYINDATTRQKHFSNGCQALRLAEKIAQHPMALEAFVGSFTENGAELCIPSLKHISGRSKELPFNLMDFSTTPDEKTDPVSGKTIVRGKWKKRLYDCVGCPDQLEYSKANDRLRYNPEVEVDPYQYVFFVDSQTWAKTMTACFNEDVKNLKKILNSQSEEGQEGPRTGQHRTIVTSEYGDGTVKYQQCKFEYYFSPGHVIKVQMVANPLSGLLTPQVRLFQVSKNLSLCLTHMEDPVGVLSKYATESSKKNIESIAEYQRIWLPLLEMEAATSAVHSEENVIINNVKLVFKSKSTCDGYFEFDSSFIINRGIEFCGINFEKKRNNLDTVTCKMENSDYLCIRCPVQAKSLQKPRQDIETIGKEVEIPCDQESTFLPVISSTGKENQMKTHTQKRIHDEPSYTWVGHAQVTEIKRSKLSNLKSQNYLVRVSFKFNSSCCPVPRSLLPSTSGTVEVIFKNVVDRMTIDIFQSLESSTLASSIATNCDLPDLEEDHFSCAKNIMKISTPRIRGLPLNNEMQSNAIQTALTSSFSLIQGPPGTGKTYTGIKLLYIFNKVNQKVSKDCGKRQVLFCGPSNKSVDLVAWYMLNRLGLDRPRIIRVYGALIESSDYPGPKSKFLSKRSLRDLRSDPRLKDVTLHHMIRKESNIHSPSLRCFDALFEKKPDSVTPLQEKEYMDHVFRACTEELAKCDIILCTCAVGGSIKLSYSANIQQVVIDECAMSTEPQSMVPIIASKAKQVVLIGDHKQLRPIIKCKEAAKLGLDRSLFERYADKATFLNVQYRMHEEICKFPSKKFYDGKLTTGHRREDTPLTMFPRQTIPLVFCHVEGVEETLTVSTEEGNERSKSNQAEVDKVEGVFSWIVTREGIQSNHINVMSQYNAQCSKIKEKLHKLYNKNHINVNTVVASQGGEWDYVIFSTVRSLPKYKLERNPTRGWSTHNLGFITDQNQINVALTRARKGLIIIGNKHLLKCDKVFRSLIEEYEAMGCLVNGHEFPRMF